MEAIPRNDGEQKLCTGILYDKHGQPHVCIDEYMKRHLEIKLISSIVTKAETV